MKNLKIGNKTTSVPLIQGGMGVGISLGRLAGSVAKAGGVGVISTAQIGYREPDFHRNTEQANLRAIEKEMQKAREISPDGIIGYNVMTALREQESHVRAAVRAGADIIFSGAGIPATLPEYVEGSHTKICAHCFYCALCQGGAEILGQEVSQNCGFDGGRRSFGRRASGIFQRRAGWVETRGL